MGTPKVEDHRTVDDPAHHAGRSPPQRGEQPVRPTVEGDPERRQRLEADDELRGTSRADGTRPPGVGDASVHEQRGAESSEPSQQGGLHRCAPDGIEIGDVALLQAQHVAIGPRQRDGIARSGLRAGEHRSDGRVGLTPAFPRQHGAPGAEVEHGDHAQ